MKLSCENPGMLYKIIDEVINNHIGHYIYTHYIKSLDFNGTEKVLDFGCGSGAGSRVLAKRLSKGGHLTCIDISTYWLNKSKQRMKKYQHVDYLLGQITEMNLPDASFDIIYIFYALHDVEPSLRENIVAEFKRILTPTGKVYINEPQRQDDGMSIYEIKHLMQEGDFIELRSMKKNNSFSGVYSKRLY